MERIKLLCWMTWNPLRNGARSQSKILNDARWCISRSFVLSLARLFRRVADQQRKWNSIAFDLLTWSALQTDKNVNNISIGNTFWVPRRKQINSILIHTLKWSTMESLLKIYDRRCNWFNFVPPFRIPIEHGNAAWRGRQRHEHLIKMTRFWCQCFICRLNKCPRAFTGCERLTDAS